MRVCVFFFFFFQAEDGIRDRDVTGVQTCALPILAGQDGLLFNYTYTDKNGNQLAGTAIVVTSSNSDLSYVLTLQALAADFDGQMDTFNKGLDSFKMD